MEIEFDPVKHAKNLAARKLDFRDAVHVFNGKEITLEDVRRDYGEPRLLTTGTLEGVHVVLTWTPRFRDGNAIVRIISMRRANGREIKAYLQRLEEGDADSGGAR